jgi:hypothetical protein
MHPTANGVAFIINLSPRRVMPDVRWRENWMAVVAVIGPPRDYLYAATFPKWMVFSPGVAPIPADSLTYIGIVVVGHVVMRLVSGPAREDVLARATA